MKTSKIQKEIQKEKEKVISKNYLVGAEGGFSENEKKYFAKIGLEFQNLGQIIYPSWLVCLIIWVILGKFFTHNLKSSWLFCLILRFIKKKIAEII